MIKHVFGLALLLVLVTFCGGLAQTSISGSVSGTWTKAQSPYVLSGDVTVPTGQTLVIQPGVVVEVPDFNTDIFVNGALLAQGTAADSIYIRGKAKDVNSTHGGAIFFNAGSSASVLEYVSIDRMGDTFFYGKAVSIATGEKPIIRNTTIRNSERYDVESWAGGAKNFARLKAVVTLDGSEVDKDASLPNLGYAGSFYQLLGSLTVPKEYKLTIAPGVLIEVPTFGANFNINGTLLAQGTAADSIYIRGKARDVNSTHGGAIFFNAGSSASVLEYVSIDRMGDTFFYGKAVSIATGEKPVIRNTTVRNSERYDVESWAGGVSSFTRVRAVVNIISSSLDSDAALPNMGYATSFYRLLGDVTVPKEYKLTIAPGVMIEVPDFNTDIFVNGALLAQGTAADSIYIRGKAKDVNSTHGGAIFFNAGSSASVLEYVSIDRMGDTFFYGKAVSIATGEKPIIRNTTIRNSERYDVESWAGGAKNFARLKAVVTLDGSEVDKDASLPNLGYAGSFYQLLGSLTVPKEYKLTIAPGVLIEVPTFGANFNINGTLLAQGTAADSIYIRGKARDVNSTHGGAIFFNAGSSASVLEYVSIDRMGDTFFYGKAVEINTDGVRIARSTISNSEAIGIRTNASSLTITASNVFGNLTGIYNNTGKPWLQNNKIYSNTDYGINNGGSEIIDARSTYWGASTGPLHPTLNPNGKGNKVSDRVLFTPWIEQVIQVDQTISFSEIPAKFVDDTLVLTATATSTLPVSFSITTQPGTGVALLTGNRITFPGGAGQVTVTAYQPGNEFFKPAQLQRTFSVSKRSQSISFILMPTQVVGRAPVSLTATASSGLPVSFSVISGPATLSGNALTFTAAGIVVIEARQPGDRVYSSATPVQRSVMAVLPTLSIINLPPTATEGQTVSFKVATNLTLTSPLAVFLQSSNPTRFPLPASVTIAAGALSTDVSVTLAQNNIPEIDLAVTITAGASDYNPATGRILVNDDDLPNLELVILATNISESAGANATQAVLRRTSSSSSIAFTANLSASLPNTLLLPASISLAEGEKEKTFTIGAVNNSALDGQRLVTVTASLFVASCGCNAPTTSSGSVSATLIVNDDDGPSLTLSTSQQTLREGLANAGSLRITRNGPTTNALSVTLTSSDLTEATLPATIVIPAGQAFVDVAITTIDDGITDGNQTVYFTATAAGLSPGSTFVIVTDLNQPDLQIPLVQLSSNTVQAGAAISYQVSIKNSGGTTAPVGTLVRGYLSADNLIDASDIQLSEDTLGEAIPAGQTKILSKSAKAPGKQGVFKLLFWINPNATLGELLLTNNVSQPVNITLEAAYTATATVAPLYVLKGTSVPITGRATRTNGSTAANVPVEVYVITSGIRRTFSDTTDAAGNFSVPFVPLPSEAGHYIVGACFPGLNQTSEQDGFDILGVRINRGNNVLFTATLNQPLSGSLPVENLSGKSLSNFTLAPVTLPTGASVQFTVLTTLAGNTTATIGYTVSGSALTSGNNYVEATLQATSSEGIIQKVNAYYYCQAASAHVVADIVRIQANVSQSSGERRIEVKLTNIGKAATGTITINLPDVNWLTNVTPKTLPSLAPGDTAVAVLKFSALGEVPVNSPITGNIGINSANGNSFSLPFTFQKVSEATGTARIIATDQFTYNTNNGNGPKVKDALVKIANYFTGEVYAQGYTSEEGLFAGANIPEGKHRITVEKEKHLPYTDVLEINPGATTEATAFLNYQAITFNWVVVPTTVQDQYETTLEATFETNVPMPVVTIEMPKTMPQLSAGQEYQFMVTLTNHGLITAKEVTLNLPAADTEYEFITNYIPGDLLAKQSIQIPVLMRRRSGPGGGRLSAEAADGPCTGLAGGKFHFKCGPFEVEVPIGASFTYAGRTCAAFTCSDCYASGVGTIGGSAKPVPFKLEKKSCVACLSDIAQAILSCIPGGPLVQLALGEAQAAICFGGLAIDGNVDPFGKEAVGCLGSNAIQIGYGGLWSHPKNLLKGLPVAQQIFCALQIVMAIRTCAGAIAGGGRIQANGLPNAVLRETADNLQAVADGYSGMRNWMTELFGDLLDKGSWPVLMPLVLPYLDSQVPIFASNQRDIIEKMAGYDMAPSELSAFFIRWNTSLEAKANNVLAPNAAYPSIINWNQVRTYVAAFIQAHNYSVKKGFKSIDDMHRRAISGLNEIIDGEKKGVCASVTVQFSQQLTMTREAFEGTLEIVNGHPTDAMKTISVNIQITDQKGTPSNGLFEIQPQNPASLSGINAGQKGLVKFLFIPQLNAAPQTPTVYTFGGSVTYWDPYAGATVTLPLTPVPITVNPSPNLTLHYFMERNILGDDALTTQEVEPSVPAELAVMVENQGYGPAREMTISSAQPKIVDNEKGLAVDFSLIGSNLQGKPVQLGLTNINFGTIEPLTTKIGQWYFTSSLLGKFVSYDAKIVHTSSFGNKNLSLVQGVKLHELTKSIRLYGPLEDSINDFLVNDVFDVNDVPDVIYFSQGNRTAKVSAAASGSFNTPVSGPRFTNTLTITPSEAGFNYIKLPDPGNKLYELASVTRSDGQVIPLTNAWLTFVSLPVLRSPVYENKFHLVDNFATTASATYTVVWKLKDVNGPKIDSIVGTPTQASSTQVKNLKVYFNKRIDPLTFTYEDLTLSLQGGPNIINSAVVITPLDSASFNVDLSAITTGNGLYVFTAQASTVKDRFGVSGTGGKQVSWSQFCLQLTQITAQPASGSVVTAGTSISVPLSATGTNLTYRWTKDGVALQGASTSVLNLTGVTASQSGTYVCTVSGDCGRVTSQAFVLTVTPSPIILAVEPVVTPFLIEIYPNPVTSDRAWVMIRGAARQSVQLQLIDMKGRTVWERHLEVTTSEHTEPLDISNLSTGMLLLRASTTDQSQIRKLIKL
ncbi:T9SS type A sorting domain-containing protein [Fibrella forsythiae]|uniref:T9SS type A sorting domain-containing protein n=1 Tax=Fibrella forsythiae TaxID=2817061 RepID=A0ABS3JSW5_9BACT|nr:T9SS type A sorting domain-containing protein [Fibrella forsythiae]MBO0953103.1 T9SS type A sorting domain-containing protein [Fibrella forsythiae]